MLIATATNSYADKELNRIVVDTFTMEEYFEWLKVQQQFQAKESTQPDVDPHLCLYPQNLEKDECIWYKNKYGIE